eukprot:1800511-Amphidinium_carterae.1
MSDLLALFVQRNSLFLVEAEGNTSSTLEASRMQPHPMIGVRPPFLSWACVTSGNLHTSLNMRNLRQRVVGVWRWPVLLEA